MKFVIAALVVILFFWLINSANIDRHASELDGPLGWRNAYSLRNSALAQSAPDSTSAASQAITNTVDPDTGSVSTVPNTGSAVVVPNTGKRIYTVQPGDTLGAIAFRFGVTVGQILYANPSIRNANLIYAGQPIIIPPPGSPSTQITDPSILSAAAVQAPVAAGSTSGNSTASSSIVASAADPPVRSDSVTAAGEAVNAASPAAVQPSVQSTRDQSVRVPASGHWIYVSLASQRVIAYDGSTPVRTFIVSTGISDHPTNPGVYQIYEKFSSARMTGQGYDLPDVPYVMYYEQGGYALHGTYWRHNFGAPMSHGCVNLATPDAEWLYNWASLGTTVVIQ